MMVTVLLETARGEAISRHRHAEERGKKLGYWEPTGASSLYMLLSVLSQS